jgi:DNA-binding beta-propeller fold protein YncE
VLVVASRFVYVLNRGVNAAGNGDCTTSEPCQGSNITQFVVGGNGVLTAQSPTYFSQGINPFRLIADSSGNYLFALDHDAPDSDAYTGLSAATNSCTEALGGSTKSCGDVTVFKIDQTTGRLSVVENTAVTSQNCPSGVNAPCPLTYFPVPPNPVDFALQGSFLLTMSSSSPQTSYPYTGGTSVWPYGYSSSSGQLTLGTNGVQQLGIGQGTALVLGSGNVYVLDNEPLSVTLNGEATSVPSQILPFSVSNGNLQALAGGIIPDSPGLANPIQLLIESKGKYLYVANQGNNVTGNITASGIAAYFITTTPSYQAMFVPGEPFGSGTGPQCIVEDPSDQFIYEANEGNSVTGRVLDPQSGELDGMRSTSTYTLQGPATWCFVDGRTG